MSTEAMKLIEALKVEYSDKLYYGSSPRVAARFENELTTLREALAQPQQEPVAWRWKHGDSCWQLEDVQPRSPTAQPLYTSPPAQEIVCSTGLCHYRKPLTDEDIEALAKAIEARGDTLRQFARAIEAAHNIKENT